MSSPLLASLLFLLLLTGCGNKPDGTPYGVNPTKHPHGQAKTASNSAHTRDNHYRRGIPK